MSNEDEKSKIRPNVVDGVDLKIEISDNPAEADGTSLITATATVTKDGKIPAEGEYTVHFEIMGSDDETAKFDDTNTQDTHGANDEKGVVVKHFYDTEPDIGSVEVHIKFDTGGGPHDDKPYEFIPINPDNITIDLQNNNTTAGSGNYITAPVTAYKNGDVLKREVTIYYQILPDDNAAKFYDEDGNVIDDGKGKKTTAKTDPNTGITSPAPRFKSGEWEDGTIQAWWEVSHEDKPAAEEDYAFNAPKFQVTLNPLTTNGDDDKTAVYICATTPAADLKSSDTPNTGFTATAIFQADGEDEVWKNGGDAVFTFSPATTNAQIVPKEHTDKIDTNDGSLQYAVPINTDDGTASLTFYDTTFNEKAITEKGTITASVVNWDDTVMGTSYPADFTFVKGWHSVSKVVIEYNGRYTNAWIYANDVQQAKVLVSLTLVDRNGKPLTETAMPSVADLYNAVKLTDYLTGDELGTGSATMWNYKKGNVQNADNGWQNETHLGSPASGAALDSDAAGVDSTVVTLTFYVTGTPTATALTLGVSVTPNGYQVVADTGDTMVAADTDDEPIGKGKVITPCPTQNFKMGSQYQISITSTLNAVAKPHAYSPNIKAINGRKGANLNDNGPVSSGGEGDTAQNYWRQWNYIITIDTTVTTSFGNVLLSLSKAEVVGDKWQAPYCFAEMANGSFYTYKGYLWPANLGNADEATIGIMEARGAQKQQISLPQTDAPAQRIYLALYMAFSGRHNEDRNGKPVRVALYDQFGNKQIFQLDDSNLPQDYDLTKSDANSVMGWNPFQDSGRRSAPVRHSEKPRTTGQKQNDLSVRDSVAFHDFGKIYLISKKAEDVNQDYTGLGIGEEGSPAYGYARAVAGAQPLTHEILTQGGVPDIGDYTYASTSYFYFLSPDNVGSYKNNLLRHWGENDPVVFTMYVTPEQSYTRLTPVWNGQLCTVYFINSEKYLYYPGGFSDFDGQDTFCFLSDYEADSTFWWRPSFISD